MKRVPLGGGLGGGSADAAAVLRWAGCADRAVAASLGADVPFCLDGGHAHVGGRGERVEPLPHLDRSFVLLVPPFGVDTARVYRAWDRLAEERGATTLNRHPNELTAAAATVEPRLGRWRDALREACGCEPVLAGSGSTWFAEGELADFGLAGCEHLGVSGERGRLIGVRTVPARWAGHGVTAAP